MAPLRVLYAEDSATDADLARAQFDRTGGFELEVVNTGQECLARLHRHSYDALLLDNHLLDMEGTDVLRALAARDVALPIVVVTGVGDESLVVQVLRLGASDYVPKSGNYCERLPAILRNVIAEHRRLDRHGRAARRQPRRVLYVEHDPLDVDLALKHLRATAPHLSIEVASSCRDALARLPLGAFDLVLVDLRMPDMTALDLLHEARLADIRSPFIVITGRGDEEAAAAALKLGASDYIVKHADYLIQLPYAIDNAVDRARLVDLNRQLQAELSERRRAEAESTRLGGEVVGHRRRIDEIMATVPALIWETWEPDARGQRRKGFVSSNIERLVGYTVDEWLSTPDFWLGVVHPDDRERAATQSMELFASGTGGVHQFRLMARDGRVVWVEARASVIRDEEGTPVGMRGVTLDITASKEAERARAHLEQQLHQAQKIESIGRLAGGIAHDFNNLLTVINGHADLLLHDLPPGDPRHTGLSEIRAAGERAAELTGQLLAFSRKQMLQPRVIAMNALIGKTTKMLTRLLGEDVELVTRLDPELGQVAADPGQIDQVLLNLAVNARDAMPQGGRLTLETSNVALDEAYAHAHVSVPPGYYVLLTVTDTGIGMSPETMAHLFEPFFTTKEQGKGTGLGLATVYGIVKQSRGWIWVYSEPGHGTSFKIYLPRIDQPVVAPESPTFDPDTLRGSETILLVEDDDTVRRLASQALRKYGYTVLEAANGPDALEAAERHRAEIPLMVTDVVMPQMSGRELAAKLRQRHDGMRVLYMSGYTDDAVIRHGLSDASMLFLQKPFTPRVLVSKVRDVLDRPEEQR